jgi:carbamoyl-phosphate synthase large subunit
VVKSRLGHGSRDVSAVDDVTEIEPRFSGGLPLSLAAGADLVFEYVRIAQGEPPSRERPHFRVDVTMTRHLQEVILPS